MDLEEQYDRIYRFCYYRLRSRETAEDITQETFLRFLNSHYSEWGKRMSYLYTIAKNLCIEEARRASPGPLPEDISDAGSASEDLLLGIHVRTALEKLPEDDRELLILRYVNDERISTICEMRGMSRFALYRKLGSLKKTMRRLLEGGE